MKRRPGSIVLTPLKLLFDVAVFRFGRLEMANTFAALSIAFAIGLGAVDMAVRFVFGVLLNILAGLNNDYYDVDQDLESAGRNHAMTRFLKEHMRAALVTQVLLAMILAVWGAWWSLGLVVALVLGAGNSWIYSWKLKHIPYLDVVSIFLWGALMPLVGFPLDSLLAWCLIGQLALFSGCFEALQVIRDHADDSRLGVRTTAVHLGVRKTIFILRVLMALAAIYGILILHRWIGIALVALLLLPIRETEATQSWNRVRLVMGLVWLALVGWVFWQGGTNGFLVSIRAEETISALSWIR
ncbi:MAG: UbiA family prenyltransferase [Deltaproteobacteria bacterium]|nr:UbiA family prenyltransferase [Deltaproteobacteria bacterium]